MLITEGHYADTSEVMHDAIGLLQEETETRQMKRKALQGAVQQGVGERERSEFSRNSVQENIAEGKRRG